MFLFEFTTNKMKNNYIINISYIKTSKLQIGYFTYIYLIIDKSGKFNNQCFNL